MTTHSRIRIWGASGPIRFYFVVYVFYALISLTLLIAGALERNGTAPLVTGIFMSAISLPLVASFIGSMLRPLVIDGSVLRVPRAFSTKRVPLTDISGIGLVYRVVPRLPGWGLEVWDGNGERIQIRRFLVSALSSQRLAEGVKRRVNGERDWTIPVANENADRLSGSRAGHVAVKLYEAVLAAQGSTGPLTVQAQQKALEYNPNLAVPPIAWWSPDGEMGRAHGLPAADPSKLADPSQYKGSPSPTLVFAVSTGAPAHGSVLSGARDVPKASPDVQQARRRNLVLTFAMTPLFVALAVTAALLLNRPGHLAGGEFCAAVLSKSLHPSAACNAWRHHRVMLFLWPALGIGAGIVVLVGLQIRGLRTLQRASREAPTAVHSSVS